MKNERCKESSQGRRRCEVGERKRKDKRRVFPLGGKRKKRERGRMKKKEANVPEGEMIRVQADEIVN